MRNVRVGVEARSTFTVIPHSALRISVAPRRPEHQLPALAAAPVADDDQRVAEKTQGDLAARAGMQVGGGQPHGFTGAKHAPGVEEGHDFELDEARLPEDGVARFQAAQQLAASGESPIVVAAQRAVAAHGDERPLARFHLLLRRDRRTPAHPFRGEPPGHDQPLDRLYLHARVGGGTRIAGAAREQRFHDHAPVWVELVVARVEYEARADDLVGERHRRRVHRPGREIVAEDAGPGQRAEVAALERGARERAQRTDHPRVWWYWGWGTGGPRQ